MSWWQKNVFKDKIQILKLRARLIASVRDFFDEGGFLAVETPVLQTMPCADTHIHGFHTEYFGPDLKKKKDFYLQTSPEFAMKKLLVAGCEKIYQICPVFRNGESTKRHSPEFTMIEWYRSGANYEDIMDDCELLIRKLSQDLGVCVLKYSMHTANPNLKFFRISVAEAFDKYAKINLEKCLFDLDFFKEQAKKQNIRVIDSDGWDDVFFAIMDEKIEPYLGMEAPTILYDYPANMAALSRKKKSNPNFAERFELYICGLEIANAFSELTDAQEQRVRFQEEMAYKKELYGFNYPLDEDFLSALEYGMPEAGGIALGIDRLVMLFAGAEKIDDVLWTGKP